MKEIEELINAVKIAYKNTLTLQFVSDENGKILWQGGKGISENTHIAFPDNLPMSSMEEKYAVAVIDGKPCCVRGMLLSGDGKGAILWTAFSMSNIVNELGVTDSYDEVCRMISDSKHNVERILLENEESVARDPRRRNSSPIINQNNSCFSLLKQLECLDTLFTVIYKREVNNTTLNIIDVLNEIAEECNLRLEKKNYNISITSRTVDHDSALIKGNRFYLHVSLMAFINRLLSCSKSTIHDIKLTFDGHRFIIAFTFERDMYSYADQIGGDFSVYCAKMYIRRLGGSVGERDNTLFITLPQYIPRAFHSSEAEFVYDKSRFRYLTDIFLFNVQSEDGNTNKKNRVVNYKNEK